MAALSVISSSRRPATVGALASIWRTAVTKAGLMIVRPETLAASFRSGSAASRPMVSSTTAMSSGSIMSSSSAIRIIG